LGLSEGGGLENGTDDDEDGSDDDGLFPAEAFAEDETDETSLRYH